MEICRLYEVVRQFESALTLIKPDKIKKIRVSPIIENDIQSMGEGDIYSYFKIHIETEDKYTEFFMGDDITHYKDASEKKWIEESQMYLLVEYIEDRMDSDYLNSFWEDLLQNVEWKPL